MVPGICSDCTTWRGGSWFGLGTGWWSYPTGNGSRSWNELAWKSWPTSMRKCSPLLSEGPTGGVWLTEAAGTHSIPHTATGAASLQNPEPLATANLLSPDVKLTSVWNFGAVWTSVFQIRDTHLESLQTFKISLESEAFLVLSISDKWYSTMLQNIYKDQV